MRCGDRLAVYGSLRRPYDTRRLLGIDAMLAWLGPAVIPGRLHDLGTYPALVDGTGRVAADLFEVVSADLAAVLDPFEGYKPDAEESSMYLRRLVRLVSPDVDAWVYLYRPVPPSGSLVACGDWVSHLDAAGRQGTLGLVDGP
jgi:gamma-glutamylcyclotransferase (GGCT)/AIG2-like uncharacterized protein YtfP